MKHAWRIDFVATGGVFNADYAPIYKFLESLENVGWEVLTILPVYGVDVRSDRLEEATMKPALTCSLFANVVLFGAVLVSSYEKVGFKNDAELMRRDYAELDARKARDAASLKTCRDDLAGLNKRAGELEGELFANELVVNKCAAVFGIKK